MAHVALVLMDLLLNLKPLSCLGHTFPFNHIWDEMEPRLSRLPDRLVTLTD